MSTVVVQRLYTPEDLLKMPDGDRYELVDGELVERNMAWNSSWIGGRLTHFLNAHCDVSSAGWVAPANAGYQCFPNAPDKVRRPNASFIRLERLTPEQKPEGHCRIAPDAAAEVVSPNDLYSEVEGKVAEYLEAGVSLVWVIHPPTRTVRVHRKNGITNLKETDFLSGEGVIPGFSCLVGDLFRGPDEKATSSSSHIAARRSLA